MPSILSGSGKSTLTGMILILLGLASIFLVLVLRYLKLRSLRI